MNSTAFTYYITLMAKCTCYLIAAKLQPSAFLPCTDSSQSGWFHVETCMHVLRLYFANTAGAKIVLSSKYNDRLVARSGRLFHYVLIHVTNYRICNILCLNK